MNQYKSGKWTGAEKEKKPLFSGLGSSQPAIAGLMCAAGLAITLMISGLPSASNSATSLAFAAQVDETTAQQQEERLEYPRIASLFSDLTETEEIVEEEYFNAADYTTSLSTAQVTAKLDEAERQAKAWADTLYRYRNANAVVSAGNRNLYLSNYHYGNSQPFSGAAPVHVNPYGIPMSQYTVPSSILFDSNGIPTNYSYVIDAHATAYYTTGGTATGTHTYQGTVAVDPRQIPYGTEMWITSADGRYVYGYCRAEDTGGFIYFRTGVTVDLYMSTYEDCCAWGYRSVRIYVLSKNS